MLGRLQRAATTRRGLAAFWPEHPPSYQSSVFAASLALFLVSAQLTMPTLVASSDPQQPEASEQSLSEQPPPVVSSDRLQQQPELAAAASAPVEDSEQGSKDTSSSTESLPEPPSPYREAEAVVTISVTNVCISDLLL